MEPNIREAITTIAKSLHRLALMTEYRMLMEWHTTVWSRRRLDSIERQLWGEKTPSND